jgi:hypothetical protein
VSGARGSCRERDAVVQEASAMMKMIARYFIPVMITDMVPPLAFKSLVARLSDLDGVRGWGERRKIDPGACRACQPVGSNRERTDVLSMYNDSDWRALSRRLALKFPNLPALRFSRPLIVTCALLLIVVGILNWLDYWG